MLAKCMQRLGLPIRISARREHSYLYLKQSDQIVTLLTALGAHTSVMHIEDLRIRRQVLETVNRAMNCDSANLQKQMDASHQQLEVIQQLIREDRLSTPSALSATDRSLRGSTRRMPRWNSWVNRWTRPLEKAALTIGSGG